MTKYTTKPGAHPSIQINTLNKLPRARYIAVLTRVRNAIAKGRKLVAYDDETPGDKSTSCSWGLCHESAETWPDAQDHTFPKDFEKYKRISPLSAPGKCPMDKRETLGGSGCFWTCRVFQAGKGKRPTREQAIALYDDVLAALQKTKKHDPKHDTPLSGQAPD